MASGPAVLASSGAYVAGNIANFTSNLLDKIPPSVQTYIDTASGYIESATGINPNILYGTAAATALLLGAIPTAFARSSSSSSNNNNNKAGQKGSKTMSRYGWSTGRERGALSPFSSTLGDGSGGVPAVTDDDFSYITSEDLENHGMEPPSSRGYSDRDRREPRTGGSQFSRTGGAPALVIDDDDILLIKNKGATYPEHFPAYSIGDGQLLVGDIRERVQLIMKLSDKRAKRVKLLYKGRQLKDENEPVCKYGVKNNSEIMVVLPDPSVDDESSDESSEEIVVVGKGDDESSRSSRKTKTKKRRDRKKEKGRGSTSPRDSNNGASLDIPVDDKRRETTSGRQSPASAVSGSSAAAVPGGPIDKLNTISTHFKTTLLPLCVQFTASPPSDLKKREDEHRKLAETIMQQVLLKLDEVDTGGEEEARFRRKELVRQVQEVLKGLDSKLHG